MYLYVSHVSPALAAAGQRLAAGLEWRKADLEQLVHGLYGPHEVLELPPEDLRGVSQHRVEIGSTDCDEVELLLDGWSHRR